MLISKPAELIRIRERAGHTQASLGRVSGVTQGRISDLEARPRPVRPTTAKRLADALAVDIDAITQSDVQPAEVAS